jgi:transposase
LEVVYERCCGLDVHKRVVVACLLTPGVGGRPAREVRTFGSTTPELLQMQDWLLESGCTHMAMESTGSYWKPVYNLFEGTIELLLVNAQHLNAVPGRKTDVRDAEWIATLLRHGLLKPSFVPSRTDRELRELSRYRTSLVRERASEVNRIQKVLEGANIKLSSIARDVVGVSGRTMIAALAAGEEDPAKLAAMARGKLRPKVDELTMALEGNMGAHQRFLLGLQLRRIEEMDRWIAEVSKELEHRLEMSASRIERLMTIPGVGRKVAETLLAEVGPDMARFPTARHLASWAGICPGNNESAGKTLSGRTRKGSPWLRATLVQAAHAVSRTQTYLGVQFRRLAARRGVRRAAVAVAHTILIIVFYILRDDEARYEELGPNYFDERDRQRVQARLTRRLEALGFTVALQPTGVT